MPGIWELLGRFEFIGKLAGLNVGGVSLYCLYAAGIFAGLWAYLAYAFIKGRGAALKRMFSGPYLYVALAVAAFFFLFGDANDLSLAFSYEAQDLADAAAAVAAKDFSPLLRQDRIAGLIFAFVLYLSSPQALNLLLCLFLGLFYAVWGLILEKALGFRTAVALSAVLLAAGLHQELHYTFSAYAIFSLFFSALFLYRLLLIVRDPAKDVSFFYLAQPVYLILAASLFRQESVVLFPVYFTGLLFAPKPVFRKALLCLLAGAVLYLPFLYRDWVHEEHQVLKYDWDQSVVEQVYFSPSGPGRSPRGHTENYLLVNVAEAVKGGGRFDGMSRRDFTGAVTAAYFMPQPSLMNIWYNLKYRSSLFMWLTFAWLAVFLSCLPLLRRLRVELKYLSVLSVYIWSLFLVYHLASLTISIGLSYNYLLPAYLAFGLVAARGVRSGKGGAV